MREIFWLSRYPDEQNYGLFSNEASAIRYADGEKLYFLDGVLSAFCFVDFERVTNAELSPGEYYPIRIHIENLI